MAIVKARFCYFKHGNTLVFAVSLTVIGLSVSHANPCDNIGPFPDNTSGIGSS